LRDSRVCGFTSRFIWLLRIGSTDDLKQPDDRHEEFDRQATPVSATVRSDQQTSFAMLTVDFAPFARRRIEVDTLPPVMQDRSVVRAP